MAQDEIKTAFPQFGLEDRFPDLAGIFIDHQVNAANATNVIVAFDTNALLLPYGFGSSGLSSLRNALEKLAKSDRLFMPARVAREFARNRDKKLAEFIKRINDDLSKINVPNRSMPPLIDYTEVGKDIKSAIEAMLNAKNKYSIAVDTLVEEVRAWSGNDPVTKLYNDVFGTERIVELLEERDILAAEWDLRLKAKVPPGYKDANKDDSGIGDFLIWKTLMQVGKDRDADIIFVTDESKPDWWERAGGNAEFTRPELIHEFAKECGGKNIRLVRLHVLLEELAASPALVADVQEAEIRADVERQRNQAFELVASLDSKIAGVEAYRESIKHSHPSRSPMYGESEAAWRANVDEYYLRVQPRQLAEVNDQLAALRAERALAAAAWEAAMASLRKSNDLAPPSTGDA